MYENTLYMIAGIVAVLLVLATVCNSILLHLLTKTNLNTVPNKYLASLLKSDLMCGVFVLIALLIALLSEHIAQNSMFCFGMNTADRGLAAVAAWSLVGLSIERLHFYRNGNGNTPRAVVETRRYLTIIWIACFAYGLICSIIQQSSVEFTNVKGTCILPHHNRITDIVIFTADFIGLFVVPAFIMVRCYGKVIRMLWFMPAASILQQRRKKKSTLMNIVIAGLFMLLWAPFCGFKLFALILDPMLVATDDQQILFASLCLDCVRFLMVPVAYLGFSEQSRTEFLRFVLRRNEVQQDPRVRRITIDMLSNKRIPSISSNNGNAN